MARRDGRWAGFLTLVQADLLRGSYIDPGRSRTPLSAYARVWLASSSAGPTTY